MVNATSAQIVNLVAKVMEFPAQIDFLHMGKEVFVQAPHLVKDGGPDCHACACSPEYGDSVIIAARIFLQGIENSSPAKRISQRINKSACGPGILELSLVSVGKYFRLR